MTVTETDVGKGYRWRVEPNTAGFGWFSIVVGPLGGQLYRRWHASKAIAEVDAERVANNTKFGLSSQPAGKAVVQWQPAIGGYSQGTDVGRMTPMPSKLIALGKRYVAKDPGLTQEFFPE